MRDERQLKDCYTCFSITSILAIIAVVVLNAMQAPREILSDACALAAFCLFMAGAMVPFLADRMRLSTALKTGAHIALTSGFIELSLRHAGNLPLQGLPLSAIIIAFVLGCIAGAFIPFARGYIRKH